MRTLRWEESWPRVREAVLTSKSRREALQRISRIRGQPTTWEALSRAWRRNRHPSEGEAAVALGRGYHHNELGTIVPISGAPPSPHYRKHLVIPDVQAKPGVPLSHMTWAGRYAAEKRPDIIILLGDVWDLPSLSSYDSAVRKAAEGRAKRADIDAGNKACELFAEEIAKVPGWQPEVILLEGNHDGFQSQGRIGRYLHEHPEDEGLITPEMFADSWLGWTRVPFLEIIERDGVLYCHLFPFNREGRTTPNALRMGAPTARAQVQAMMQSCTAGHRQHLDTHIRPSPRGNLRGLIAGSFYQHDEEYMGPGNDYWRGIVMKHRVKDGDYSLCEVGLDYLRDKFS